MGKVRRLRKRFLQDDEIVVGRLPSESPKGIEKTWHSRLEKILVDISVDKLLTQIIPQVEYYNIFENDTPHGRSYKIRGSAQIVKKGLLVKKSNKYVKPFCNKCSIF